MAIAAKAEKPEVLRFMEKHKAAVLIVIVSLGFCLPVRGIDHMGFNEDEVFYHRGQRGFWVTRYEFMSSMFFPQAN